MICCSQAPSNTGETWFSLKMGKGMAKLRAPLSKQPAKDMSWFIKKAEKNLATSKKKMKGTPKDSKYYNLRVSKLAAAEKYIALLEKIQTLHEDKKSVAAAPKE